MSSESADGSISLLEQGSTSLPLSQLGDVEYKTASVCARLPDVYCVCHPEAINLALDRLDADVAELEVLSSKVSDLARCKQLSRDSQIVVPSPRCTTIQ